MEDGEKFCIKVDKGGGIEEGGDAKKKSTSVAGTDMIADRVMLATGSGKEGHR